MQIPQWVQWVFLVWGLVMLLGTADHLRRAVRARPGSPDRSGRIAEAADWGGSTAFALGVAAESLPAALAGMVVYGAFSLRRRLRGRPRRRTAVRHRG
ncbi:hypothetical protein [Streptomyces sp. NPDC097619]|uniref:hypothetical protein n=1 Tax=Streptomyces sp. NPDC097619 TaxID=3157228 RepID=UPI003331744B